MSSVQIGKFLNYERESIKGQARWGSDREGESERVSKKERKRERERRVKGKGSI